MNPTDALDLLKLHSDWLWSTDAAGHLIAWEGNNGAPSVAPCTSWITFLRRDSYTRDGLTDLIKALRARKTFHCLKLACILPHAGVRGWIKISGVPVHDALGRFIGYRGAAINMTGQMMSERKVRRLGAQVNTLTHILDNSPIGILMADPRDDRWPITYVNQAVASMYGALVPSILGRGLFFMQGPETSAHTVSEIRNALHHQQSYQARLQFYQKDGTPFWGDLTLLRGCTEDNNCHVIALLRDATLDIAREDAEVQRDRLQALGRLAGGLAHEINNLLQPARLYTEMLGDEIPEGSIGHEFLRDISSGLEQVSSIVKNTLHFSRQDDAQGIAVTAPVGTLVTESLGYLGSLFPPSVIIEQDGTDCALPVQLRKTELTQVLGNLLINATQAMDNRGRIRIQLSPLRIDGVKVPSNGLPHGLYVRLAVSDTGCGMDSTTLARVFEPFFTTKPPGEGTGLGLSVVYGLVTGWGGDIRVDSMPGQGTTFTLLIPVTNIKQGVQNECEENSARG